MTILALRVAMTGQVQAGEHRSLSGRSLAAEVVPLAALAVGLVHVFCPDALTTPTATFAAGCAILVFGLPHGTLDIVLIRRQTGARKTTAIIGIYLGLALAMAAIWAVSPPIALFAFLALSITHFAEDWLDDLPPFIAHGLAIAVLTAPALTRHDDVVEIFALLVGGEGAARVADAALLTAPLALAAAAAAIVTLWTEARHDDAIATVVIVLAMLVLPPAIGFALFFCLHHSPRQLAGTRSQLGYTRWRDGGAIVVALTLAALFGAVIFAAIDPLPTPADTAIRTAFITLSVLTLPHLLSPALARRLLVA